jgi:hypothetical protein
MSSWSATGSRATIRGAARPVAEAATCSLGAMSISIALAEAIHNTVHNLAAQQRGDDPHVLLGVASRLVVRQPIRITDQRLVRRTDAQGEAGSSHGFDDGSDPIGLQQWMTRVGLQNGRAEFNRRGGATGDGGGGQRIARDAARVPQRAETLLLGAQCLPNDPVSRRAATSQTNTHGPENVFLQNEYGFDDYSEFGLISRENPFPSADREEIEQCR